MRTSINIDDDVLAVAKQMAKLQRVSTGAVISRLLREAMSSASGIGQSSANGFHSAAGFQPFPSQGVVITNAQIDALYDAEGI